ncbi:MAG: hypothetical protein FWH29_09420 [Methanobrevibacter sp.]|nr:hypothetical protein [Methanobrevibacter sp.]
MYKINATYDGKDFKFEKPLPKGKYNVELKFIKADESKKDVINEILELSGVWDEENVDLFDKIIKERKNFSSDRVEL